MRQRKWLADHHDELAGIAPTLAYTIGAEAEPWQLRAERIGRALGRSQQAAELTRRIEQRIRSTREQHPEFEGKTVVSGPVVDGKIYVINRESDAAAALQVELGLMLSPKVAALPESFPGRAEISLEQISLIEADVIMLTYVTPADRRTVESSELFQRLEAVQRGTVPLLAKALTA